MCAKIHIRILSTQNDNIVLIGLPTRDFVTRGLGRSRAQIESRQCITLPHGTYVYNLTTNETLEQLTEAERVREPIDARDGVVELKNISLEDICFMIERLCCA